MENNIGKPAITMEWSGTAADGSSVKAYVQGEGPVILILHAGMDTGKSYERVANYLSTEFCVIRLHRRQYRRDLKSDPIHDSPCTIADEVQHVLAVANAFPGPIFLYVHSSGGAVALESLLHSSQLFDGAMIYEPALAINSNGVPNLSGDILKSEGEPGEGLKRMRQALLSNKPGKALGIFTQIAAGWPEFWANLAGGITALIPAYRSLIPCQIDDLEALERLGIRMSEYAKINLPVTMVSGEKSPISNKEMTNAVAEVLPLAKRITINEQGHSCHTRDPQKLADIIKANAEQIFLKKGGF